MSYFEAYGTLSRIYNALGDREAEEKLQWDRKRVFDY